MVINSKTFRVFISSTFRDMKDERDALQAKIFPKLEALCNQHGARFQAIDLRWGVSNEAGRDQKAVPICMGEIYRCQEVTQSPNFVALLGDRYGWTPPPYKIDADEFDTVTRYVTDGDKGLLERWYRRDDNAVPAEYLLQPRENEFVKGETWEPVEEKLHSILGEAAKKADITPEQFRKYYTSVTEQEIEAGIFNVDNADKAAFCFFRLSGTTEDGNADLKRRLRERIPNNIEEYQAGDIDRLCDLVYERLSKAILEQSKSFETLADLEVENLTHEAFRRERARSFIGRVDELKAVEAYLTQPNKAVLAFFGQSGVGKSALMAKAIERAQEKHPEAEIIYRFIGTSPRSSDARQLLSSLSSELGRRYNKSVEITSTEYNLLGKQFQECLTFASAEKPLIIFLDALDQFTDANGRALNWLPANLPNHVHLIVSTLPNECLFALQSKLPQEQMLEVRGMDANDAETVLDLWLQEARRSLQPEQKKYLLDNFAKCPLPLYLKLAFEEARLWHSYDEPSIFAPDVPGIIEQNLFSRLADNRNHGELLLSRSLSFIAAARDGIAEGELLELLARDNVYFEQLEAVSKIHKYNLPEKRIPVALWVRLYSDLAPYLTERGISGTALMSFYHRQFGEAVERHYLTADTKQERHVQLAEYFGEQPVQIAKDTPNLRKLAELPYQQAHGQLAEYFVQTLSDFDFLQNKLDGLGLAALSEDYNFSSLLELKKEDRRSLELIQSALNISAHILLNDSAQLAFQLLGRLLKRETQSPKIAALLQSCKKHSSPGIVPTTQALQLAGGALARTLTAHSGWVMDVALSGDTAISASADRTIMIWNWRTGELQRTLFEHSDVVESCAISGDFLVSASRDKSLKVWNWRTGEYIRSFEVHTDWVTNVVLVGDDAISSSRDGIVKVWNWWTGEETNHYKMSMRDLTVTGDYLIGTTENYKVSVLNWRTGETLHTLGEPGDTVSSVDVFDNYLIGGCGNGLLKVWDWQTGQEIRTMATKSGSINALAIAGDFVVSGSNERRITVWNWKTGAYQRTLLGHTEWIAAVAVSGNFAVTGAADHTLKVWDWASEQAEDTQVSNSGVVRDVALSDEVVISGGSDHLVRIWDLKAGTVLQTSPRNNAAINRVQLAGEYAVSAAADGILRSWKWQTFEPLHSFAGHTSQIKGLVLSGHFAISASWDKTLQVWNWRTGQPMHRLEGHYAGVNDVALSGNYAISASVDGTLKVWNWQTGECIRTLVGHQSYVFTVVVSSMYAVSASYDRTLKVWNWQTGELIRSLEGHSAPVNNLVLKDDIAVSSSLDKTLKIWNWQTGELLFTLTGHRDTINGLQVLNTSVITASLDRTVKIWNWQTGKLLATFTADSSLSKLVIAKDGSHMVVGSEGGAMYFLRPNQTLHEFMTLENHG